MKSFIVIKRLSKAMMYFSAIAVVILGSLFVINKLNVSADSVSGDGRLNAEVLNGITSTANDSISQVQISVNASFDNLDHYTLFINSAGQPDIDISDKSKLCAAVNSPKVYKVATNSCTSEGDCTFYHFWNPSLPGTRQIIALYMSSETSVACAEANIIDVSSTSVDLPYLPVATEQYGAFVSINNTGVESKIDETYKVNVDANSSASGTQLTKLILYAQKADTIFDLTPDNICSNANSGGSCILCKQAVASCDAPNTNNNNGTFCNKDLSWKPSQEGLHNIVAVAIGAAADCTSSILGFSSYGVYVAGNTAGTDPAVPPGETVDGGTDTGSFKTVKIENVTVIKNVGDILKKINWFVYAVTGIIIFSTIVFSGITFITAGGNEQQTTRAKKAMAYGITAGVLVFLAYFIVSFSVNTLNELKPVTIEQVDEKTTPNTNTNKTGIK